MRCHHFETHIDQQVGGDDALSRRTVTEHLDHLFKVIGNPRLRAEIGNQRGAPEGLECTDTAAHEIRDHRTDQSA